MSSIYTRLASPTKIGHMAAVTQRAPQRKVSDEERDFILERAGAGCSPTEISRLIFRKFGYGRTPSSVATHIKKGA